MDNQNLLVENKGQCHIFETIASEKERSSPYRLYRFLTDLEDILETIDDDYLRLRKIVPLVRQLLDDSPWLLLSMLTPNPETGWDIMTLYDEPYLPITIQLVAWASGTVSRIHNHGCWGLVTLISGQEINTFWLPKCVSSFFKHELLEVTSEFINISLNKGLEKFENELIWFIAAFSKSGYNKQFFSECYIKLLDQKNREIFFTLIDNKVTNRTELKPIRAYFKDQIIMDYPSTDLNFEK